MNANVVLRLFCDKFDRRFTVTEIVDRVRLGSNKTRFQVFCPKDGDRSKTIAFRAIQGHSSAKFEAENPGWKDISAKQVPRLFHGTTYGAFESILRRGLLPAGGQARGGRDEVFFSPADPRGDPHSEFPIYKFSCDIIFMSDTKTAEEK